MRLLGLTHVRHCTPGPEGAACEAQPRGASIVVALAPLQTLGGGKELPPLQRAADGQQRLAAFLKGHLGFSDVTLVTPYDHEGTLHGPMLVCVCVCVRACARVDARW